MTPEISFIDEEEGASDHAAASDYVWALDPIDGTANFVHGVPLCGVSLALMHGDHAVVAAVSLPYLGLHYSAVHGAGAYVNGKRINVRAKVEPSKSMITLSDYALGDYAIKKNKQRVRPTAALAAKVERIRMFGQRHMNSFDWPRDVLTV